jgi:putative resolvase
MRAKNAMKLLGITRVTLFNYVKNGKIKAVKLPNGYFDYDEASIYKFLRKSSKKSYLYARVSTYKQSNDLLNQIDSLKTYCDDNNILYANIYSDISSGLDFNRPQFSILLDEVINNRVDKIYITYKDRLSRHSFNMISEIFSKFGTDIVVINDNKKYKDSNQELFEEIVSLMHCYSTKIYSNRVKKNKIKLK